jgi:hypothetical protein
LPGKTDLPILPNSRVSSLGLVPEEFGILPAQRDAAPNGYQELG